VLVRHATRSVMTHKDWYDGRLYSLAVPRFPSLPLSFAYPVRVQLDSSDRRLLGLAIGGW